MKSATRVTCEQQYPFEAALVERVAVNALFGQRAPVCQDLDREEIG